MLNPFFLQGSKSEQGLVQDLINEQLRMYGVEIYYLPRSYATEKTVIKELIQSNFNAAFPLEAYVNTYDGYGGQGTLLSKFGIQDIDDLTLTISKERFENYISKFSASVTVDGKDTTRPREGDLIYFPLGDRLFEINYVEHESPFYQLQSIYTYELRCQLYRYEDEVIDTSIEHIDDNIVDYGYSQILTLTGSGVTATAEAFVFDGAISRINITNRGSGYSSIPTVSISKSPLNATIANAVGIATLISGLVDCDGIASDKVQNIHLTNGGRGYTSKPSVVILGGGGSGAKATSEISDGTISYINVVNGGSGYTSPPQVSIATTDVGITTATAIAKLNSVGVVTSIILTYGGQNYITDHSSPLYPQITISDPQSLAGIGTFELGELITGSVSGATARVKSWNQPTKSLEIGTISGVFVKGETITGSDSNAEYTLLSVNEDDQDDAYMENDIIQLEADSILDFTERNPFGIP